MIPSTIYNYYGFRQGKVVMCEEIGEIEGLRWGKGDDLMLVGRI